MATLKNFWRAAAVALILPSCLGNGYNSYTFSALGVLQRAAQDSSRWWFMTDDSVTYAPAEASSAPSYRRAIARMEWNSDIPQREGYYSTVNFTGFEPVAVLPVVAVGESYLRDSAPNDRENLRVDWGRVTLQYLTIAAAFSGSDGSKHKFFLLRDSLQTDQPVKLLFRHSRGGDSGSYQSMSAIMSFDLETLAERTTQDSVRLRLIYSDRDTFSFVYRFVR